MSQYEINILFKNGQQASVIRKGENVLQAANHAIKDIMVSLVKEMHDFSITSAKEINESA